MAAPLALALPTAGRLAMQYLPQIIGLSAAAKPLMEGRPLEALVSGGVGFLGGKGIQGPVTGLAQRAMGQGPRLAGMIGQPQLGGGISKALGYAVPGAAVALAPTVAGVVAPGSQGVRGAAGNAAQLGAGLVGYTADGKPVYGGAALPPGMGQYGPTSPYGSPLDVLGPAGMGQRLDTLKTAQTQRDVLRTLLPEIEAASEARSKKEFERQMAGKGIRTNIDTRAEMQKAAQDAGLRAGLGALEQAGGALTSQYQYS
tara:strand:+ start:670 stop:1440 length:771 start_codon:yes stop_codon:yes gene_type:complete